MRFMRMLIIFQFQAFDFRTTTRNEPFLQLFHSLYVYPLTVALSRKRNLFIRVELRKDDADVRRQPLEVNHGQHIVSSYILIQYSFLWMIYTQVGTPLVPMAAIIYFPTNIFPQFYELSRRHCIQGSQVYHYRSGSTRKLLLELGQLAIMMKLNFFFLPFGPRFITYYSLFSTLIFKQSLKLQSR